MGVKAVHITFIFFVEKAMKVQNFKLYKSFLLLWPSSKTIYTKNHCTSCSLEDGLQYFILCTTQYEKRLCC